MAARVIVDAGFIVGLLSRRDQHHQWAASQARQYPPPWTTCEAVLSEAFHLLGPSRAAPLGTLLERDALTVTFSLDEHLDDVLRFIEKYGDVPASLADACLVRMTEVLADPVLLTTDTDFRLYRRQGRRVVPAVLPITRA